MPGMSGLQLQKELNRQGATLPIILITGHADVRMAVEAMKAGAFEFFEKPFRTQDLCDKIQEAVKSDKEKWRRRKERENAESRIASLTPAERQVMELIVRRQDQQGDRGRTGPQSLRRRGPPGPDDEKASGQVPRRIAQIAQGVGNSVRDLIG